MKTIFLVLPLVFASVVICPGQTQAQGTAFTYQGQLRDGVNVADGKFDFKFRIWTSASGPAQVGVIVTNAGVEVRNGMFSATIDQIPFNTASLPTVKTYPINYNPRFYMIGIVFSLITTYLAGWFPARKASKIDPVVIIRGK